MKKIYSILGIALFVLSCSSNDKEDDLSIPQIATQYDVTYFISKDDIEKHPLGYRKTRTFVIEKSNEQPSGNLGIIVHFANSVERGYIAYDVCCPIHWEDSDPLKHKLTILNPDYPTLQNAYCEKNGYRSSFDLYFGTPNSGYAKEKNISLIKYQISRNPIDVEKEEIGRYITNPQYRGK